MTDWSFEHVAETRAALRRIVSDPAYGATALSNVRIMSELLPQLLRGARLERSVLVTAARESLASTMLKHVSDGMDPGTAVRLAASFLNTISPVPLEACCWVAAELALALGLITVEQADELGSGSSGGLADITDSVLGDDETFASRSAQPPDTVGAAPPRPDNGGARAVPAAPAAPARGPAFGGQPGGAQPFGAQPFGAQPVQQYYQPAQAAPGPAVGSGDWISRAVKETVHPGLLAFNPPPEMQQGRAERIEVGIARSPELRDALTAGFRGRGLPEVLQVDAAPVMGVELRGSSFQIDALSPVEQLVVPLARWEFDVTPLRSGSQTLTLCVNIRIDSPFVTGGKIAVPVLERDIKIKVDVVYGTRRFVAGNWQWLVGTAIGLGGGIAAWVALVH